MSRLTYDREHLFYRWGCTHSDCRRKRGRWLRLLVTILVFLAGMAALTPTAGAAQEPQNTWTEPDGAYTVQWADLWTAVRQEAGLIVVTDGSAVAVAAQSAPVHDLNPVICLDVYVDAQASAEDAASPPIAAGQTSWHAYKALSNFEVGSVDDL